MPRFLIFTAALAVMTSAPAAEHLIRCHERPSDVTYWAWREIDGRRCWFHGPRTTPKTVLFWERDDARIRPRDDSIGNHDIRRPDDDHPPPSPDVTEPVQPAEIIGNFERAWRELMIDLYVAPHVNPEPTPWR